MNILYNKKRVYILITFFVSLFLASRPIPWAKDDLSYLDYVAYGNILLQHTIDRSSSNPLFFLVNEPLWLFINSFLGGFFQSEMVVRIIIFFSTFMVLISLGRLTDYSVLTIFFFFVVSQILKNHITHLRQGLALGIFLLGFMLDGKKALCIRFLSPFIHTSFWFLIFIEFFESITMKLRLSASIRFILFSILVLGIILFLPFIVQVTGDRRLSEYRFDMDQSASFLGFMWWIALGTFYFLGRKQNNISNLGAYGILFYVISYFFLDFGARIFENTLPLVLAAMLTSARDFKLLFGGCMLVYGLLGWYFRGGLVF